MRIRIFGYYWQLGLVLLWVFESTVIFGSSVLAFRWLGAESPADVGAVGCACQLRDGRGDRHGPVQSPPA